MREKNWRDIFTELQHCEHQKLIKVKYNDFRSNLEVKNLLSFSHAILHFENSHYATVFNFSISYKFKEDFISALLPFFYNTATDLEMKGQGPGLSFIRIKFLVKKEEAEGYNLVDAIRESSSPNYISYYLNSKQYKDTIELYHERCHIDVFPCFEFLKEIFLNEHKNVLYNWISIKHPLGPLTGNSLEVFADYIQSSDSKSLSLETETYVAHLAETNLLINKQSELLQKRYFMIVANDIGEIFHDITFQAYSVHFVIPLFEKNLNIDELRWERINWNNVETHVKKNDEQIFFVWNDLDPGIKMLLKLSRLIALAKHMGQKCIFIEDITLLEEYQYEMWTKEAIIRKGDISTSSDYTEENFFERIFDICKELKIMVFLYHHGETLLPFSNANIMECQKLDEDTDNLICVRNERTSINIDELFKKLGSYP